MSNNFLLSWIILAPLFSACFLGLAYLYSIKVAKLPRIVFTLPALSAPLISFFIALMFFMQMIGNDEIFKYTAYRWLGVDAYDIDMGFLLDRLSVFMVLFITFVGWLIHVYASGYMKNDRAYGKFFFYFNLFLASMLLLVLADGPLIMFIGWEGVGLCSYLLISFYFQDKANVQAGNKAFIANRIGDFGFIVAMVTLFHYSSQIGLDYASLEQSVVTIPPEVLAFIGVSLFIGAMGKSAQIPLYVWLPDAMAGPTPVSALIHAATMVTAGVYMVARFHFLYDLIPNVGLYIAYIGAFSALFAAIIATKQSDIKKILAYSTMSQLGYMFIASGLGNYSAGIFHVYTHAFFKALLFMGAGALIVALHHEQNIFKMGQMRRYTPFVFLTMLIATLAIVGLPPFAGFFSKDEILLSAFAQGEYLLWAIGLITAVITSYYMFRLIFVVFYAQNLPKAHRIHDIPKSMTWPLFVLALGSIFAGSIGIPAALGGTNNISQWLSDWHISLHVSHSVEWILMAVNILAALTGMAIAYKKFFHYDMKTKITEKGIVYNKFYIDELYDKVFVKSLKKLSVWFAIRLDINIIDAIVMGISRGFVKSGRFVSLIQNANTRFYAFIMLLGLSAIATYLLVSLG